MRALAHIVALLGAALLILLAIFGMGIIAMGLLG